MWYILSPFSAAGLVGLVEEDWLQTIVNLPAVEFLDFVLEGRRLATELRSQGAQLVIALTHMRMPNAEKYVTFRET
jgi:5'-nucleotidase